MRRGRAVLSCFLVPMRLSDPEWRDKKGGERRVFFSEYLKVMDTLPQIRHTFIILTPSVRSTFSLLRHTLILLSLSPHSLSAYHLLLCHMLRA